jgi:hypothetical protein
MLKQKTLLYVLFGLFIAVFRDHVPRTTGEAEEYAAVILPNGYRMDQVLTGLTFRWASTGMRMAGCTWPKPAPSMERRMRVQGASRGLRTASCLRQPRGLSWSAT